MHWIGPRPDGGRFLPVRRSLARGTASPVRRLAAPSGGATLRMRWPPGRGSLLGAPARRASLRAVGVRAGALRRAPAAPPRPRGEPLVAQRERGGHVARLDGLARRPGTLEHAGEALEAGLRQERRAAVAADLAVAQVGVPVPVRAERRHGVVDVERPQPVEPDEAVELVEHLTERLRAAHVVAGREQGAGIEADPDPLVATPQP